MDKITVTKENIWDIIERLRSLDFGVTIGTCSDNQYKVSLVYWAKIHIPIDGYWEAESPEKAIQLALESLELDKLLEPPS